MTTLWRIDPRTLPKPTARKRKLGRKPLIDLASLQYAINSKQLGDDNVLPGTTDAQNHLEDFTWSFADLLDCIACLRPADYRNSEWCQDRYEHWYPCDAYAIRYDDHAKCRVRFSDINYYLKFSLTEDDCLTLVLISCHL